MSQFAPEDHQGAIDLVSDGDITLESDRNQDGVGDLVFRTAGVERSRIAHDGTFTGLAAQANVPTIQELFASTYWPTSVTVTTSFGVFTLPFAADIKAASVVLMNGAIAADDTNYWTVEIMKWRNTDGVATTLATKTTKLTGGQAFVQRADWNFDAIAFSGNTGIAKGYTLGFRFTPTGAPSAIAGALMTMRYEPN